MWVRLFGAVLLLTCLALPSGQTGAWQPSETPAGPYGLSESWTFDDLSKLEGVEAADIETLRKAPEPEAREAVRLARALSSPDSVQLLASFLHWDGGSVESELVQKWAKTFSTRPKRGAAGMVQVAALALRAREELTGSMFKQEFQGVPEGFAWPDNPKVPQSRLAAIRFQIDGEPARRILDMVERPHTLAEIEEKLKHPIFPAMFQHRAQSFYPWPITREKWALALQQVSMNQPIHQLYAFIRPSGFLDLNDVKANAPKYRRFIDKLASDRTRFDDYVRSRIAFYVPDGAALDRKVYLAFGRGSDGWGANGLAAIDLEFHRQGLKTFLETLAHEAFHSAQQTVREQFDKKSTDTDTPELKRYRDAMRYVFMESTANYVSSTALPSQEKAARIARAVPLLEKLHAAALRDKDSDALQKTMNEGISGGGPFYWYGAQMSAEIVEAFGLDAFRNSLKCGERCFFDLHHKALAKLRRPYPLSQEFLASVRRLR